MLLRNVGQYGMRVTMSSPSGSCGDETTVQIAGEGPRTAEEGDPGAKDSEPYDSATGVGGTLAARRLFYILC